MNVEEAIQKYRIKTIYWDEDGNGPPTQYAFDGNLWKEIIWNWDGEKWEWGRLLYPPMREDVNDRFTKRCPWYIEEKEEKNISEDKR